MKPRIKFILVGALVGLVVGGILGILALLKYSADNSAYMVDDNLLAIPLGICVITISSVAVRAWSANVVAEFRPERHK